MDHGETMDRDRDTLLTGSQMEGRQVQAVTYKIDKSAAEGEIGKYLAIPSTIGIILIDLME